MEKYAWSGFFASSLHLHKLQLSYIVPSTISPSVMSVSVAVVLALHSHCHVKHKSHFVQAKGNKSPWLSSEVQACGDTCGASSDYYVASSTGYNVCNERRILYPDFNSITYYSTDFALQSNK